MPHQEVAEELLLSLKNTFAGRRDKERHLFTYVSLFVTTSFGHLFEEQSVQYG